MKTQYNNSQRGSVHTIKESSFHIGKLQAESACICKQVIRPVFVCLNVICHLSLRFGSDTAQLSQLLVSSVQISSSHCCDRWPMLTIMVERHQLVQISDLAYALAQQCLPWVSDVIRSRELVFSQELLHMSHTVQPEGLCTKQPLERASHSYQLVSHQVLKALHVPLVLSLCLC